MTNPSARSINRRCVADMRSLIRNDLESRGGSSFDFEPREAGIRVRFRPPIPLERLSGFHLAALAGCRIKIAKAGYAGSVAEVWLDADASRLDLNGIPRRSGAAFEALAFEVPAPATGSGWLDGAQTQFSTAFAPSPKWTEEFVSAFEARESARAPAKSNEPRIAKMKVKSGAYTQEADRKSALADLGAVLDPRKAQDSAPRGPDDVARMERLVEKNAFDGGWAPELPASRTVLGRIRFELERETLNAEGLAEFTRLCASRAYAARFFAIKAPSSDGGASKRSKPGHLTIRRPA